MSVTIALMLATTLLQPEEEVPTAATDPYRCWIGIEMAGLAGAMWRDFEPGRPDEYYQIQILNPDVGDGAFATWSVDNRPPARRRPFGYGAGPPEAEAFRNGPDSVAFGTIGYGRVADGAISARMFGDGVPAGTILVQRPKATRRTYRLGGDGLWLSVPARGYPEVFAKLAKASRWEAVLVDASGRELGRKAVSVPSPAVAEAAFNRARAELLRHRDEFLAHPTWNRTKVCSTHIEERDAPI